MNLESMTGDFFKNLEVMSDMKNKAIEKIMDHLFKDDSSAIQRTTDLDERDLIWATKLEIIHEFLVDEFIYDPVLRDRCHNLKNSIYRIRVSKNRLGRAENFEALKSQIHVQNIQEMREQIGVK